MADGFEINDVFYKLPDEFRMGDPVLVEEVTGLSWGEFSDRLEEESGDPVVMLGMLAVAVWQANPRWRRDRAARFVEAVNIGDVKFIGEEKEDDKSPPFPVELSAKDDDSTSKSNEPADGTSAASLASITPVGSPAATQVSA